jgi:hypothetical protein
MGALRGTWLVTGRPRRAATPTGILRRSVRGDRIVVGPARPTVDLSRRRGFGETHAVGPARPTP